jgi:hypothetical protein
MTSLGMETRTFRLVTQCLNLLRYCEPRIIFLKLTYELLKIFGDCYCCYLCYRELVLLCARCFVYSFSRAIKLVANGAMSWKSDYVPPNDGHKIAESCCKVKKKQDRFTQFTQELC